MEVIAFYIALCIVYTTIKIILRVRKKKSLSVIIALAFFDFFLYPISYLIDVGIRIKKRIYNE